MPPLADAPRWRQWHSLRWRLPVTISLVVVTILAVMLAAAYREVESALLTAGAERARAASAQVASLLDASLRPSVSQIRVLATSPSLRDYLKQPRPDQLAAVEAALGKALGSTGPRAVTLWDLAGVRLAEVRAPANAATRGPKQLPPSTPPSAEGLQPLRPAEDGAFMEIVATVDDTDPQTRLGFLALRSTFALNPPDLFSKLVGDQAVALLGNRDGSNWVDLETSRRVESPRVGDGRVGVAADVGETPLQVWVGFPEAGILAPARRFLERMILLGLLVAFAGAVLVRALTARMTRPLSELTAATEAVAAGDYSRTIDTSRRDEIGRLSRAFDAMTTKVAQDITERERVAAVLQENEDRLHYTLTAARVGTWQMDPATGVVEWSDTMGPLFGVESSRLPATRDRVADIIHPEDRPEVVDGLMRDPGDRREREVYFRGLQPDGRIRWLCGRSRRITDAAGTARMVGVCFDVTEQKTLEEQLRQSQKMDAIGKLAGGIAHDFNNLLTAILGFGNFLLESLPEGDARRQQVQEILRAGSRAADLTAQLLSFSRKQMLQPVIVDVNDSVRETAVLLGRLIGEDIRLETVLSPEPSKVRSDPVQLQQIVMNLAINARDAMPHGGTLTIQIANVELDDEYVNRHRALRPGPHVLITVSDTGVGMTEEVRARLFEPFFTTKKRGEGTGLGLATVYGAVRQAGGYIWAESDAGRGSRFKVFLPRLPADTPVGTATQRTSPALAGTETILLVEDEEAVRLLTSMILARAGYRVIEAPNAEDAEATHLAHSGSISLLLTDVVLPGSSGPDLFQRLALRDPRLKVLYMSGYTDDAVFRTGRLQPGVAFVQKPFTADVIRSKTREVLDT